VNEFPRSKLMRTLRDHPVAAAATVVAVAYFGPAKLARLGMAGLRETARNANQIAPVLQQILRSRHL
jgi:hypothetical protein